MSDRRRAHIVVYPIVMTAAPTHRSRGRRVLAVSDARIEPIGALALPENHGFVVVVPSSCAK